MKSVGENYARLRDPILLLRRRSPQPVHYMVHCGSDRTVGGISVEGLGVGAKILQAYFKNDDNYRRGPGG